ncbi:regulator of protease activity HflC (stomatin/prohibitin superfamily) [Rhizomicrobium palustre]|uniref:Regulator of protease activity HflC (Stomatin/prohibitin superfamily) n=1 Tax=Rhizomicrobium palustre TaxID=189966 RepID=A0A846N0A4_9PROT|nr:SPFH domain-containing protein [Rhizomicrobium palustre]NIK88993.1 regulator of protease activity HflC (stomatin/prohibitin superfamily) [Rhizomicrobium palustre]
MGKEITASGASGARRVFSAKNTPLLLLALLLPAIGLGACGRAAPDSGQEAVLIRKPWVFGHGGIEAEPVKTGLTYTAITTQVVYISVMPQLMREHFADIMTSDGVPLSFDGYVQLRVIDSVKLVDKFGGALDDVADAHAEGGRLPAWYAYNLQGPIRNTIRMAVKKYGLNEIAIAYTADEKIEHEVKLAIAAYIAKRGMPVELVDFNLGKTNPPDAIRDQRVRTAAEQQRQITEKQTQLAEEARKGAELARADADNAYREKMQLTPEQFIRLQQIDMQRQVCNGGKCTFIIGGNVTPVVPVK